MSTESSFHCPGFIMVEDRRIRCHKTTGHGSQTFVKATMNSCNLNDLKYLFLNILKRKEDENGIRKITFQRLQNMI